MTDPIYNVSHFGAISWQGAVEDPSGVFYSLTLYQTTKFQTCPNSKHLPMTIIPTQKLKFALGIAENIVGKGENACYQHFLLFPLCFQKLSFSEMLKVRFVWKRVNSPLVTALEAD